jgi:IclR family acetate operon transcriptional repressor
MVYHGYVKQDEHRAYVPGPAQGTQRRTGSTSEVYGHPLGMRILRQLADAVDGTAHVVSLEGNSIRFLAGVESSAGGNGMATTRVGWLLPAHSTAGGRAILARLPDEQLDALFPDGLPATRSSQIVTVDQLRVQLEEVRKRGYALSRAYHESIGGMGVAFEGASGGRFAVTVAWPPEKFPGANTPATVQHLRTAARQLVENFV